MEVIMDVDSACGRNLKLKRKRSSEQLMLRKTVKHKVFLQDLQYEPTSGSSSNDTVWCDENMNISDDLSKLMASKCIIEKGRWMLPQQCMIGKANYQFAVIGYTYDLSDGGCVGRTASDQQIDRQSIAMDKSDAMEMSQGSDTHMMLENDDTQKCGAIKSSPKCVKQLFGGPNVQQHDQMENWFSEFWSGDMTSTQRPHLKDHLNGYVSYSYRTHFFLNH